MPNNLIRIADRLFGRPLLITPEKAQIIHDVLFSRMLGPDGNLLPFDANRFQQGTTARDLRRGAIANAKNGVATITIDGSLVNRGAWLDANSGLVSYEGIAAQLADAVDDPEINAIVLDINSPGGEATGMFGLARQIAAAGQKKRVVAVVNDVAASAAYGLASQANEIVVSESSVVGSIGVVLMHVDRSAQLEAAGVKPTLIHAGAHKVDGNSFEPLPKSVRADMQAEVDKIYSMFTSLVGDGRGKKLTSEGARSTEARVFLGEEAVARGLADRVGSFEAVVASLSRSKIASKPKRNTGVVTMSHETTETVAAAPVDAGAVKARIKAITGCTEAEGRADLASHLAFETDLSVEAAKAILSAAPKAVAQAAAAGADAYVAAKVDQGAIAQLTHSAAGDKAVDKAEDTRAMWKRAAERANARFG